MSFIRQGLTGNLAIYLTEPAIGSNASQIEISNTAVLLSGERVYIGGNTGIRPAYFQISDDLSMGNVLNLGGNVESVIGFMANSAGIYFNNGSGIYTSVGSGGGGGPATNAGPGLFIDSNSDIALAYNPTYLTLDVNNNLTVRPDSLTLDRLDPTTRYITLGSTDMYLGNTYTSQSNLTLENTNIGITNPQYGRFIDLQVDSNLQTGYLLATNADILSNLTTGNLTVTANIQAGYLLATNADILSNLTTGNLTVNSNLQTGYLLATNADILSNLTTGNLTVNSNLQAGYLLATNADITSNLETGNLTVNSNLQAVYLLATNADILSNLTTGNLSVNSNLQAGYLQATNADITSNLETGNLFVTSNLSTGYLLAVNANVTGNIGAGNLFVTSNINAGIANITSNLNAGTVTSPLGQFTEIQVANHAHLANASTSGYLTVQGNLTVYGSATITNNLFVTGNIFNVNSNVVSFNDVALFLAANTIAADGLDRGVFFHYYDTPTSNVLTGFYGYDVSDSKFAFSNNVDPNQAHVNVFSPFGPYTPIKSGNVTVYDTTPKLDLQDYTSGNTSTIQTTESGALAISSTSGDIRLQPVSTASRVNLYGQTGIYNNQNNTVAASTVFTTTDNNVYINFGSVAGSAVPGSDGYGIRSNVDGVIETKSSGGSWQQVESTILAGFGLTRSLQTISANPDNSTLEVGAGNVLQVKSAGITNTQLANSSITIGSNTLALGSTYSGLDLTGSFGYLTSNLVGSVVNSQLGNSTITIGSNTLALGSTYSGLDLSGSFGYLTSNLSGQVNNSQLGNSTITIGSNTLALGSTYSGLDLSGSFGYLASNLVGQVVNSQLANSTITIGSNTLDLGSTYSGLDLGSSFGYSTSNLVGQVVNSQLGNTGILIGGTTYTLGSSYSNIALTGSNAITFGTAGDNYIRSGATSNLDLLAKENLNLTANTDIILTTNTASTIKLLGPGGQINILPNTTPYINFTSTSGETGIGIRATSAGIMQFKNTAGTWSNIGSGSGSGSAGGSNTNIQFNDGGSFGGSSTFTFDKATNLLTLTGNALLSTTGELRFRDTTSRLSSSATGNLEIQASNTVIGTHLIASNTFNMPLYTNSTLTSVATTLGVALDFNMASNFLITMSSAANITLNNPQNVNRAGQQGSIFIRTPLTGGGHSLQWYRNSVDSAWFFPGGGSGYAPSVSLGLNTYDVFNYIVVESGASPKILVTDATGFTRYS